MKIDAETVTEALMDIYSRLATPEQRLSDQESQSTHNCMRKVCHLLDIKQKQPPWFDNTGGESYRIDVCNACATTPISLSYTMKPTLRDELEKIENLAIIRERNFPYAYLVFVVKKTALIAFSLTKGVEKADCVRSSFHETAC
ncbi:hypothetical protein PoB_001496000 [Plakobranchus ocellatus]|uniref:Uncharacterized protein n=1 Tax=Plakobranchus ocellatus TaxID=259542 RepID=A0AAV3YZS7_9GAST|nr:hypothetical protein PoB_001496000 [Plakobranchus ocellatus]